MKSHNSISRLTLLAGAALFSAGAWSAPPGAYLKAQSESLAFDASTAMTPEGAVKLYARLQETAARVCTDPLALPNRVSAGREFASCVKQAVDAAVVRIRVPMVSMVHLYGPDAAAAVASR
jgi:UrcA family protein